MDVSQKSLADEVILWLTKLSPTDESRLDSDLIYAAINKARAEAIVANYKVKRVLDQTWFQDLGMVPFHRVNFADDVSLTSCKCDISKAFLPQVVSLEAGNGNQDLGLTIMSSCGTKKYTAFPYALWSEIPSDHERAMFNYFARINTATYVNKGVDKLRVNGIWANPEDGKLIQSEPIASGSIVSGVVYIVKFGQIIYNGAAYPKDSTFTGAGVTTFAGNALAKVYLNSQVTDYRELDPYPITPDMARNIVLDVCVKEFGLERQAITEQRTDSRDDATKQNIGK